MPVASDAVQDVVTPQIEVAVASDAVQDVVTPQIEMAAAANVARPVIVKKRIRMRKIHASVLKTIPGFEKLNDTRLQDNQVRQVEPGQVDENDDDIGGRWVGTDAVSVCTGDSASSAIQWFKKHLSVIKKLAKSLTFIDVGHSSVSYTELTNNHTNEISVNIYIPH